MGKRLFCLLLSLMLVAGAVPFAQGAEADHQDTIDTLNALLSGMSLSPECTLSETSQWSEETVARAVYRKLIWSYQYSDGAYLKKLGINTVGYGPYDLDAIDALTRDFLGRDFPRNIRERFLWVEGNSVVIDPAAGESTKLAVQDYYVQGDRLTAVGVAAFLGGYNEFEGYFKAEFRKNADSVYGYTLVSLEKIGGNQDFSGVTATASSYLDERTVVHYPQRVLDGNLATAWCEGASGVGVGEWIQLTAPSGGKMSLIGVQLRSGYQADQKRFTNNGWPTELLVECEGGYSQHVSLHHYDDFIFLDTPVVTQWIRFTILDAQPGEKYEDTCISEIQLVGVDITGMKPEDQPLTPPPANPPEADPEEAPLPENPPEADPEDMPQRPQLPGEDPGEEASQEEASQESQSLGQILLEVGKGLALVVAGIAVLGVTIAGVFLIRAFKKRK